MQSFSYLKPILICSGFTIRDPFKGKYASLPYAFHNVAFQAACLCENNGFLQRYQIIVGKSPIIIPTRPDIPTKKCGSGVWILESSQRITRMSILIDTGEEPTEEIENERCGQYHFREGTKINSISVTITR